MSRIVLVAFFSGWAGLSLLFSLIPVLQRPRLSDRLRPYSPSAPERDNRVRTARSAREVIGPMASAIGGGIAKLFGVNEDLRIRLRRVHSTETPTEFRIRQLVVALWATLGGALVLGLVGVPLIASAVLVWIAPLLGVLVVEQQLAIRSDQWKRNLDREIPVIAEQLAMLLNAGYSLSAALLRVAGRTNGAVAADLNRVNQRVRQGLSESEALTEWSKLAKVPSVDRLVAVLRLNNEAADLGRLVSEEAKVSREEGHRRLLETMERKAQAVWIPVTVAALLPGVVFLSVPFLRALSFFAE